MTTPASIRLPLRLLSRRAAANPIIPSTNHLRQHPPASSRRHASNDTTDASNANPSYFDSPIGEFPDYHRLSGAVKNSTAPPSAPESANDAVTATTPSGITDQNSRDDVRLPRAVQAAYLRPLRKQAQYGVPSCDLQLRSYNVRNIEFFADFAMRAAYYLSLPAYGPIPLPRIVERWTVPRASFIFKKSQENFERRTVRRLIQIKDGHPETVQLWLAFLKKHQYYGVGMKANVWEYEGLDVATIMDKELEGIKEEADEQWKRLGLGLKDLDGATAEKVIEFIDREDFRAASGTRAPMTENRPVGVGPAL